MARIFFGIAIFLVMQNVISAGRLKRASGCNGNNGLCAPDGACATHLTIFDNQGACQQECGDVDNFECEDYGTCEGACGSKGTYSCWCDAWCVFFGDCCKDIAEECSDSDTVNGGGGGNACNTDCKSDACGTDVTYFNSKGDCQRTCVQTDNFQCSNYGTCVGECGGYGTQGCFCDSACTAFGDCCKDFEGVCLGVDVDVDCQVECDKTACGDAYATKGHCMRACVAAPSFTCP